MAAQYSPRAIEIVPLGSVDEARLTAATLAGIEAVRPGSPARSLVLSLQDDTEPQAMMATILQSIGCRKIEMAQVTLDDVFVRLVTEHGGHSRIPLGGAA